MKKDDIQHLGELARITLSDTEVEKLQTEIPAILEYVSKVDNIVSGEVSTKHLGPRYNVFRADEVHNEPDEYTAEFLREAPQTNERYLRVKRILQTD